MVTEVPLGSQFQTKNRSVCEKDVTGTWGSYRLLVIVIAVSV